MPNIQDQSRILDRLQGAVLTNLDNAAQAEAASLETQVNNVIAAPGSLASGAVTSTVGSDVSRKNTGQSALILALGIAALFVVIRLGR